MRDITVPMTTDSKFPLRMTQGERATVESIRADAEKAGVSASLNDVIRHLIRCATLPAPQTEEEARAAILTHWADCRICDPDEMPLCLDGLRVQRNYVPFARVTQTV